MENHTKVYYKHFGYFMSPEIFIKCELCNKKAQDIHHITMRGIGGGDEIENLIATCRGCHNKCHKSKEFNSKARQRHVKLLEIFDRIKSKLCI